MVIEAGCAVPYIEQDTPAYGPFGFLSDITVFIQEAVGLSVEAVGDYISFIQQIQHIPYIRGIVAYMYHQG